MSQRALSFGSVAAAYEQFRPGYPTALAETVIDYAGRPITTALEIGAGTGKATRLFAAHGITVTATEPDPAMLAELRRHVPASVRTLRAAFEELPINDRYDLVYAAAALHWTNPDGRCERLVGLLKSGGIVASFGGPIALADPAVEHIVCETRAPFLDSDDIASPDGTPAGAHLQWPGTEWQRSALFTDVREYSIERRLTMTAAEYVGHLSTVSAYLELPVPQREALFAELLRVLSATVDIDAGIIAHLARRAG